MANINLSQSSIERRNQSFGSIFDKGFLISLGILVLVFGSWIGLDLYGKSLDQKILSLDQNIQSQTAVLSGESVARVADFQARLDLIKKKFDTTSNIAEIAFASVEKAMVSGVFLNSYEYSIAEKRISLEVGAHDFKNIAQQALALKAAGVFSGVTMGEITRSDDGLITSKLEITL